MNCPRPRTWSWIAAALLALACRPQADSTVPDDTSRPPTDLDAPAARVWPDEKFRYTAPVPGPVAELELPAPTTFELDNGLRVLLVEQKVLPTAYLSLQFDAGEISDPPGKVGMNALCMQLLGEGTKRLDKASFAEKQADHAITVWANGGMETSTVGVRGLKRQLGPALDLLSELLREPGLRQEDLDRLRDRRKAQLAQSKATPAAIARRLYPALVFGAKHPYGRLESDASLDAITVADCRKVAARLAPDGARLFAVGMLTRAELEDEFAQRFGRWKGPAPRARRIPKPTPRKGQIVFVHAPEANQSQVWLGHPGPPRAAADYEATEVMAQILGGGFTSRINMNLREDKGFSYGGSGGIQYNKGASYFAAQSSVRADATAAAMREMVAEIRTMRRSDPTQEEIGREVEGRLLALPANFASATRSASSFQALVFHGLALDWYTHYQDRLKQVDIPGVRAAAEKHLRDEGLTVLVVGDATVVLEDLETLAKEGVFGTGGLRIVDADGKSVLAPAAAGEKSEATHPRTPDEATAKPSKSAR